MSFEQFMVGFGWLAAILFLGVAACRIVRIACLPLNVRWEVYPVPHEPKEKRRYGGSYMEEVDWATRKRTTFALPALFEIAVEVMTLKRVRENNGYGIWPLSLAMHWGLYLYFGWLVLLAVANWTSAPAVFALMIATGLLAHILGAAGALGLMAKRMSTPDLSRYTAPVDYFNLLFVASFFVVGLVSWLGDRSFAAHQAFIGSALVFKPVQVPAVVSISFLSFGAFMIYMPFTKLIHYFAKYFTFDKALWDDGFKAKDSAVDRQVTAQLGYNTTWAAPHMAPAKTWLEQAQTTALPEGKK